MMKRLSDLLTESQIHRKFVQAQEGGKMILKPGVKEITYDGKNKKHKAKKDRENLVKQDIIDEPKYAVE